MSTRVREARGEDLADLARLCAALGYPVAAEELARRIAALDARERHVLLVVEHEGRARGLAHALLRRSVLAAPEVELDALVVDEEARGRGLGERLFRAVEAWAASQGVARLRVRSRIERGDAHRFYAARGCELAKTQHVFLRALEGRPDAR